MIKKYLFNWNELCNVCEHDFSGILTLAYAITFGYNNKIAWNIEELFGVLQINKVTPCLFRKKYLATNYHNNIITFYKTKHPQSYFKNAKFLTANTTLSNKVKYLFLLSKRNIANNNDYIPIDYIEDKSLLKNPFVRVKDNKIIFTLELLCSPFSGKYVITNKVS